MKYLVFGSLNLDYCYQVEKIVRNHETICAFKEDVSFGGKGFNQAVALKRGQNDYPVYFAGAVGFDCLNFIDELKRNDIKTDYLKKSTLSGGKAIIQVDENGDNAIMVYPGSNDDIDLAYIDDVLSHFEAGDIILLQNEIKNVGYIALKAKEKGMKIVYNPSPFNQSAKAVDFNLVDYLFINEVEAYGLTLKNDVDEILNYLHGHYSSNIILTLGEKGSIFVSNGNQKIVCGIYQSEVVDTTAAGDTYTGYFMANIDKGIEEAMRLAMVASGIAVSRNGSSISIPFLDEVIK